MQPLDVAVFKPLKQFWNEAIDSFRKTTGAHMTKHSFFQQFDKAWKNTANKRNAVVGFESTGLVPYNPNRVDYRKVMDASGAIEEFRNKMSSQDVNMHEMIGIKRCKRLVEDILGDDLDLYMKRYDEGYDIFQTTAEGKLYSIYKGVRDMAKGCQREQRWQFGEHDISGEQSEPRNTIIADPSIIISSEPYNSSTNQTTSLPSFSMEVSIPPSTQTASSSSCNINSPSPIVFPTNIASSIFQAMTSPQPSFSHWKSVNTSVPTSRVDTSIQFEAEPHTFQNISSIQELPIGEAPSTPLHHQQHRSSYDNWKHSPFKHYFTLPDSTSKTKSSRINKIPSAISAKSFTENLRKMQEKKECDEREKERRKKEREAKKLEKEKQKKGKKPPSKKQSRVNESSSDEEQIILYLSSEDDIDVELEHKCYACHGDEGWEYGESWIGCNTCERWYHKDCLTLDFDSMSQSDIDNFNFICIVCQKSRKRKLHK